MGSWNVAETVSQIDGYVDSLARKVAEGREAILLGAIRSRIGTVPPLSNLAGRLRGESAEGDPWEVVYLDGEPLLKWKHSEPAMNKQGQKYVVTAGTDYQLF